MLSSNAYGTGLGGILVTRPGLAIMQWLIFKYSVMGLVLQKI